MCSRYPQMVQLGGWGMARMRHRLKIFGFLSYNGDIYRFPTLASISLGKVFWENLHFCPFLCRAHLVPSYSFGENEVYNQETFPEGTWLRFFQKAFQDTFKKILGLNFCTFHGRGLTQESWGFLPFNRPITTVGEISPWSLIPISSPRGPGT